jgi:hypothetical protein
MALPVTIPNEFASATASIPLSQLDTNFTTLADAVNGISDGSETLANASVTVLTAGTANVTTLNTSGQVVFNDAGADVDFRVEGDSDANLLFVDASTDRVGIGTSSPSYKLDVNGASRAMTSVFSGGNTNTAASSNWWYIGNVQITSSESVEFVVYGTADYTAGEPRAARTTILLRGDTKVSGLGAVGYYWGESQGGTSLAGVALKSTSTNFYDVWILPGQFASCQVYARAAVFTSANSDTGSITQPAGSTALTSFWTLQTAGTERMRITSDGSFTMVKTDPTSLSAAGFAVDVRSGNLNSVTIVKNDSNFGTALWINRLAAVGDGPLVEFAESSTVEGSISISGTTVSYNGGNLSRWAQMLTKPDLLKGTVMSNLDEMNVYVKPTLYWTEEDELPVDEEGNPTVAVGDLKQETSVSDNEQLNKVKVSDVEGDPNVAGVFVNWTYDEAHQVDEINMAMTGDMIIRIAEGVTVARGDLLMSAGDGTAKPQGDDIVRSKTIAKVTSTHITCTYEDGSYCVPCVLMAC